MSDQTKSTVIDFNQYRAKVLAEDFVDQIGIDIEGPAIEFARQIHKELRDNFGPDVEFDAITEGHGDLFRVIDASFPVLPGNVRSEHI